MGRDGVDDRQERAVRDQLVTLGASLFDRRLTSGRTGNPSVRLGDQVLLTPTGASLGALDPGGLAGLGLDGGHVGGPRPSTERETARLFLLLHGHPTRPLSGDQAERLRAGAGARRATAEEVP